MNPPDADALEPLRPLLRQLREIKGLREVRPGVFQCRGAAFLQIRDEQGALVAELKKAGGSGVDRYPVSEPAQQRRLVDEAKRRAGRGDDD